jgi:hypothetical protein
MLLIGGIGLMLDTALQGAEKLKCLSWGVFHGTAD